ncbi:MAG: hypothetical protein U0Z17_01490 [Bacteroidales bacterium]
MYYSGTGWFGDLTALPANEMVKIKKAVSQKIGFNDNQINPSQVTIPVAPGWNRIGYLLKAAAANSLIRQGYCYQRVTC